MVRIIADSSNDVPKDMQEKYRIKIVPLKVTIGDESYQDWVDITPEVLYQRIETEEITPTTSQPTPKDFLDVFEECKANGETDVLVVTIAEPLSGTYQSAVMAREEISDMNIEIISSHTASIGVSLMISLIGDMVLEGASLEDVAARYRELDSRINTYIVVDNMTMLKRGGRVSGSAAMIGTMLNIKPVLYVTKEAKLEAFDKVRGFKKAHARLASVYKELADPAMPFAVINAKNPEEAGNLLKALRDAGATGEVIEGQVGAVIGSHVGPGTVAVAFLSK